MGRNLVSGWSSTTIEEKRAHVSKVHLNFPRINEDILPDYLVEKYRDCKQSFLEYYWELSKKIEEKMESE